MENLEVLTVGKFEFHKYESKGPCLTKYQLTPKGKYAKKRAIFSYRFLNIEQREEKIQREIDNLKKIDNEKLEIKNKNKELNAEFVLPDHINLGDIIVNSWGYEQTNVNFYKVTKIISKTRFEVKELQQFRKETGWASGTTMPNPDKFHEKGDTFILSAKMKVWNQAKPYLSISKPESYFYMHKWDGGAKSWSAYA